MLKSSKSRNFLKISQIIFIIFGVYLALSLFEVWALFPFWVKNLALGLSLGAIYWFSRRTLISSRTGHPKPTGKPDLVIMRSGRPYQLVSLLVLGFLVWGGLSAGAGLPGLIMQAMTFNLTQPPREVVLNVSVSPPDYLNQADILLFEQSNGPVSRVISQNELAFPEGSIITVEVSRTKNYSPFISLGNSLGKNDRDVEGVFRSQHVLLKNSTLDIKVGPYVSIRQALTVIPDQAPVIKVAGPPALTARNSFEFQIAFGDDHGIIEAYLELTPRGLQKTKSDIIRFPIIKTRNTEIPQTFYLNLLGHPWAGTTITGIVKAVDGLGQVSESESISLTLPEKTFQNPVAQNLASIRKSLIIAPERKNAQTRRLDLLTSDRTAYQDNIGIYLSLRSTYWKLRSAETAEDIEEVTRYLWQTALKVEDDGSFEEQNIHGLLEQIKTKVMSGADGGETDALIGSLGARMEVMVDKEFMLLSRRLSLNEDLEGATLPGYIIFNTLIATLREQVAKEEPDEALKTLTTFQALFEKRPTPNFE